MNFLQAVILGIVQGLTEFIPISSTGHLVFAGRLTNLYDGDPEKLTATMAVIQLGTLVAVFAYFATDIWNISVGFIRDHIAWLSGRKNVFSGTNGMRPMWLSDEAWLGYLLIAGSVPIGIIGLAFKEEIEGSLTKNLWVVASMLILVAILMGVSELVGKQNKQIKQLSIFDAVVVGFFQVLALLPGASRSGSTITGGLFSGLDRETAARFSFLLMVPAITASGLLELYEAVKILPGETLMPLLVGTAVATVVGYLSIWFLLAYLRRRSTLLFIVYRLLLGAALIYCLYTGIISPQA